MTQRATLTSGYYICAHCKIWMCDILQHYYNNLLETKDRNKNERILKKYIIIKSVSFVWWWHQHGSEFCAKKFIKNIVVIHFSAATMFKSTKF